MATPQPITNDREALRRAQAAGWRIDHVVGIGHRLVQPHAVPPDQVAEVNAIRAYLGQRLPAVLALLNPATPPRPTDAAPDS